MKHIWYFTAHNVQKIPSVIWALFNQFTWHTEQNVFTVAIDKSLQWMYISEWQYSIWAEIHIQGRNTIWFKFISYKLNSVELEQHLQDTKLQRVITSNTDFIWLIEVHWWINVFILTFTQMHKKF